MAMHTESLDFVAVKSTLPTIPLPPHASRQPILTERLILRPPCPDDLQALHVLRTQPECMKWSVAGVVDANLQKTRTKLAQDLPPHDAVSHNVSICLRSTGEWIGIGGCKKASGGELGWPEIGYMILKDFWGRGYATEFLQAYLAAWWSLPRTESEIRVERAFARALGELRGGEVVDEMITAVTAQDNHASQKILERCGFRKLKIWRETDEENQTEDILVGYGAGRTTTQQQQMR